MPCKTLTRCITNARPPTRHSLRCTSPPHKGVTGFSLATKWALGKTVEALIIADELPKTENLIAVVVPCVFVPKWRRELRKNARSIAPYRLSSNRFEPDRRRDAENSARAVTI